MPKRKRKQQDLDVIKTERDNRRAAGRDDDDDLEDEQELELHLGRQYNNVRFSHYKRSNLRKPIEKEPFPFMSLPAEVRNMIYRYLVVSKAKGKIVLGSTRGRYQAGGIEIAIMLASRQIYNEAAKIMYDENKCVATYGIWECGVGLREDDPKTKTSTSRSLRSGREVDMVKHKGLIYEHVLKRLRHVEFRVNIFDRTRMCDHMTIFYSRKLHGYLLPLWETISTLNLKQKNVSTHGKHWEIIICSVGLMGPRIMKKLLEPLLRYHVYKCVELNKLKVTLEGKFPLTWEKMFRKFEGDSFVTEKVEAVDTIDEDVDIVGRYALDDIFDGLWD